MTKTEKLIHRIFEGAQISYEEAERVLLSLGFMMKSEGSHHVFRKKGYARNIICV